LKKIISLFKRDYDGTRLVYDEIVDGAEWVPRGEGIATVKYDGTACLVKSGKLYKRYDRRLSKKVQKQKKKDPGFLPKIEHYKPAPDGWEAVEELPDQHTGHWPGWLPVGNGPEDKWHREAFYPGPFEDGTYELVGPKVQGNPYSLEKHELWRHGSNRIMSVPRTFMELREWFKHWQGEGIVWHHPDGHMVKIKRRDFGLTWPATQQIA